MENTVIKNEYKNVAVFGQGFVGLPLSLSFSFRGCNVYGVDVIKPLVDDINAGITHHTEEFEGKGIRQILNEELQSGRYRATCDMEYALKNCNNIIVTVGIPIKNGKHDISDLVECCTGIGRNLKKNDLVVIRSTVIPGTTEDVILPILERESGMKAGEDFYLGYSSERIAEGNAFNEFAYMPTIVGGINKISAEKTKELLSIVCKTDVIIASDIKVVETAKVFENVQRDVNIAMVQEFARFAEALGIDTNEVIRVANTHKRVNLLIPGPGVGGYCIPNAYHYLAPKAEELGVGLDLLKLSRSKNAELPNVMVSMFENELKKAGKSLEGIKVAVLGIAMKDYSNDDRISPPIEIVKILKSKGAKVAAYDPAVPTEYDFKVSSLEEAIEGADGVVVLAKQKEFDTIKADYLTSKLNSKSVIFDTRNLFADIKDELTAKGILFKTI
ncbi:capsular polysaccharide biosynthesis protein [Fervidicella metallireducens AeB]|uniref:Capsular polysaccharide biosynthesis protein n=1 Tax=Fervidicella metallireducens AeB TaxID=1403537 RepID=A0A017RUS3_9CLOT|nr:nucleotide sugar dehydrogenase [Fervidicella metallireducens]EYE87635.1 capsular polysaccharide biosynthesis protein [Fervidicella metallireducens AeB]